MNRNSRPFTLAAVSLVCVLFLGACNCIPTLRYITISPTSATISVSTTQQFTAQAYYSNGNIQNATNTVAWSSSNTAVATISSTGVATAVGPGTTTITAFAAGTSGATATLNVNQLTSISVTPATATVPAGGSQQFMATGTYTNASGTTSTTDITSLVTWSVTPTTLATITQGSSGTGGGLATAGTTQGTGTVSATLDGITGTASLTVGAPAAVSLQITPATPTIAIGNALTFLAQEVYSDGSLHQPANVVAWTNGTPTTAGLFTLTANNSENSIASGLAAGTTVIGATDGTLTASVTLTVVTGKTHFAYISNNGDSTIQYYSVSTTTSPYLTSVGAPSQSAPPTQTILNPNGQYMYWTDSSGNVWIASINTSTGAPTTSTTLTPQPTSPTATAAFTFGAVDPYGRFLFVSNDGGTTGVGAGVYGFTISQTDGSLTPIPGSPFTSNINVPECVIIDRTGSYLYATNNGSTGTDANSLAAFSINQSTGALTPLATPTYATGVGPVLGALDPSGTHIYVADGGDNTVAGFTIGTGGALTAISGTPFAVTGTPSPVYLFNLVIDPSGTHIYVLDTGNDSATPPGTGEVFGFNIGSGGVIGAAISGMPVATDVGPIFGIVIDPTGTLVAVDNNIANDISLFLTGSGGTLTATTPPTVATGKAPQYVTFYNAP